jgi:hypothetical protein
VLADKTIYFPNSEFDRLQQHWQAYISQMIQR